MRRVCYALLASYWVLCITLYPQLPERIAIHFDMHGRPNGWTDSAWLGWFGLPVLASVVTWMLIGIAQLALRTPSLWSLPEKSRFLRLTPQQRQPILRELIHLMDVAAVYTIAVFMVVQLAIFQAALSSFARLGLAFHLVLWGGLVALLVYSALLSNRVKNMILAADAEASVGRTS